MADVQIPVIDNSMITFLSLGSKMRAVAEYKDGERVGEQTRNGMPVLRTDGVLFYGTSGWPVQLTTLTDLSEFPARTVFEPQGDVELTVRSVDEYNVRVIGFAETLISKGLFKIDSGRTGPKDS